MSMATAGVVLNMMRTLRNPLALAADRLGLLQGCYTLKTRDGAQFLVRGGTSDRYSVLEVAVRRDYFRGQAIRPGAVVVDVGANIGVFTVLAARMVGPRGRVIAIEPNPETAEQLERNLVLNGLRNVSVHRTAVTAVPGPVTLHTGTKALFSAVVGVDGRALSGAAVQVPGTRLDAILDAEGVSRVDLIKIDCEGGEYEIFDSAGRALWTRLPEIVMETHRLEDRTPAELEATLRAAGYAIRAEDVMLYASREAAPAGVAAREAAFA